MPINRPALVVTRDRTKFISLVGVVLSRAPLAIASLVQLSVVSNTIYAVSLFLMHSVFYMPIALAAR